MSMGDKAFAGEWRMAPSDRPCGLKSDGRPGPITSRVTSS
mgnify:CR=1 FL=1